MNRSDHLQWCKDRALEYVSNGDLTNAVASFQSDMGTHDGTRGHPFLQLLSAMFFGGHLSTATELTKFIEAFN